MNLSEVFNAHKASGHFTEAELRFFLGSVIIDEDDSFHLQYFNDTENKWSPFILEDDLVKRAAFNLTAKKFSPQWVVEEKVKLRIHKEIRTIYGYEYENLVLKNVSGKMWIGKKEFQPNVAKYVEEHLPMFFASFGIPPDMAIGMSIDVDKCEQYKYLWEKANIPFVKGVCVYMLSKVPPYSDSVRQTETGWVDPACWVIDNVEFIKHLPERIEPYEGAYKL